MTTTGQQTIERVSGAATTTPVRESAPASSAAPAYNAEKAQRLTIDAIRTLRERVRGTVIVPGDDAYDTARALQNLAFDRRPVIVVRALDAADVAQAVRFARAHDLPLAVRSGGHSLAGQSVVDDGVVIDMSEMRTVDVDPSAATAWVQPGATSGDIAVAAQPHGLALTTGDAASVGIGGLALGGGIGWMVCKYGLTIDHLLAAELVTADGDVVRASADSHAELFWALRGGGGNFGVVTGFEFRLDHVGMILGGALVLPATADVLRGVAAYALEAPEELTVIAQVMHAPPAPFIPQEMHGQLVTAVLLVYAGDPHAGQRAPAPVRALATPIADVVMPMPYPGIFQFTEEASEPHANAVRTLFLDELDDAVIDAMLRLGDIAPSPIDIVQLRPLDGAMARVPADATAFAHRDRKYMLTAIGIWLDTAEETANRAWTEAFWELVGDRAQGAYVNFLADGGAARIAEAYPAATYERLAAVKRAYDPENIFCGNQNVRG